MPDYGDERGFQRRPTMRDIAGEVPSGPWNRDRAENVDYFQGRQIGDTTEGAFSPTPPDMGGMIRRPKTSFQNFVNRGGGGGGQQSNLGGDPFARQPWQGDEGGFDPFKRQPWQGDYDGFDPFAAQPWQGEGFDPFDPGNLGMGSGEYLSSMYGGGLDDVAAMNGDAMGMLEGAGFDVAKKSTDDRVEDRLWKQAVNSLPIGTSTQIQEQEYERLKQIYYEGKYGGRGTASSALPIGPTG